MKYYVIGSTNLDIQVNSQESKENDSNISDITYTAGGVGRNMAVCLSKYEAPLEFISVLGNDLFGKYLKTDLIKNNINTDGFLFIKNFTSASYVSCNVQGNMVVAYNDTKIMDNLTPDYLQKINFIPNSDDLILLDTNLSNKTLDYILNNVKGKKYVDAVSTAKVVKLKDFINKIHCLKCNLSEIESLLDLNLKRVANLRKAINFLIKLGLKEIIISLGANGIIFANKKEMFVIKHDKIVPTNSTGAGDNLFASFCYFKSNGLDNETSLKLGITAAILAVESNSNINEHLSIDTLKNRYYELNFTRRVL